MLIELNRPIAIAIVSTSLMCAKKSAQTFVFDNCVCVSAQSERVEGWAAGESSSLLDART